MGKTTINVRLTKTYKYPKSMLDKQSYIEDASQKASADFQTDIIEIINNEFIDVDLKFFKVEIIEEPGFRLRNNPIINNKEILNMSDICTNLTKYDMEKKYGTLDPEVTPDLYSFKEPIIDVSNGRVIRAGKFYLKVVYEEMYHQIYNTYANIISNIIPIKF